MKADTTMPPELQVSRWFNAPEPLTLNALRGRVVVLHTFQMLCPACVSHGIPQAAKTHELFAAQGVVVIGLHTVFEHHAVMNADALAAFIHEYRLTFPIGIDQAGPHAVPLTMQAYGLRGTPSVLLIDKAGELRLNHFGSIDDMALGGLIGQLVSEAPLQAQPVAGPSATAAGCGAGGCAVG